MSGGMSGWLEANRGALQQFKPRPRDCGHDRWAALVRRLERTERRRRGQLHYQRVYVGIDLGAVFVTLSLADARAVVDHYGGEQREHRVECCNTEGDEWGIFRLKGGRWHRVRGRRAKRGAM